MKKLILATCVAAFAVPGAAVAAEPWIERYPAVVRAWPAVADGHWVLTGGCLGGL